MNIEKYNKLHDEIMKRLESGEITTECAKEVNDLAFNKYIVNEIYYEAALLMESINDEIHGDDFYYEESKTIKNIKSKIDKEDNADKDEKEKIDKSKIRKAIKAYMKTLNIKGRIEWGSIKKDFKKSDKYKDLKKKLDAAESDYDKIKKDLNGSEKARLQKYVDYFSGSYNQTYGQMVSINNMTQQQNKMTQQQNQMAQQAHQQALDAHLRFVDQVNHQQFMNTMMF